ncbi:inorganic triphosphatase [Rhodoferax lacus]|uniref:Inorganic triphosphatase n=1 Tax=Rhodoferax lacus TaxID=2184758 RepID=A0A3E1RD09_9BURK|nr:CYTH and CHAD domain-containing protein [Rhodoferax lacus]RFO97111.1 inorganic triphosphatase [Rhodoferax lacus]
MELEIKFALPLQDPLLLEKQLARVPLIGRRKPQRQMLHNTYYDTPDHTLHRKRVALRVRQIGDPTEPRWVQTLKVGGSADSAFSQRGEWEVPLETGELSSAMLTDTPWMEFDPDASLYRALEPVFTTTFERLSWTVTLEGSSLEIALDRGSVLINGQSTPLFELEIELLQGEPEALFAAAALISQKLCLLPLHLSKAERAYRLAQGTLDAPLRAKPPVLTEDMGFSAVVQAVLRETYLQFTANLYTLCRSDAPEVLHQARVGWRRFKSALKLFRQISADSGLPALAPLQALLTQMTALRDLDVAASEVFPTYASAYQDGHPVRSAEWQQLEAALAADQQAQRTRLRELLAEPGVGATLLGIAHWLELGAVDPATGPRKGKVKPFHQWIARRLKSLADELKSGQKKPPTPETQHRLRILSKRLRYGVENLCALLPRKRAERWHRHATQLQTRIGLERDRHLAIATAERLRAPEGIVGFLRGAAYAASLG